MDVVLIQREREGRLHCRRQDRACCGNACACRDDRSVRSTAWRRAPRDGCRGTSHRAGAASL